MTEIKFAFHDSLSLCEQVRNVADELLPIRKVSLTVESLKDLQKLLPCEKDSEVFARMAQVRAVSAEVDTYDYARQTVSCICRLCPNVRTFWLSLSSLFEEAQTLAPEDANPIIPLCSLHKMEEFRFIHSFQYEMMAMENVLIEGLRRLSSSSSLTTLSVKTVCGTTALFEALAGMTSVVHLEMVLLLKDTKSIVVMDNQDIKPRIDLLNPEKRMLSPIAKGMPKLRHLAMIVGYRRIDVSTVTATRFTTKGYLKLELNLLSTYDANRPTEKNTKLITDTILLGDIPPQLTYLEINGGQLKKPDVAIVPMLRKPGFDVIDGLKELSDRDERIWNSYS